MNAKISRCSVLMTLKCAAENVKLKNDFFLLCRRRRRRRRLRRRISLFSINGLHYILFLIFSIYLPSSLKSNPSFYSCRCKWLDLIKIRVQNIKMKWWNKEEITHIIRSYHKIGWMKRERQIITISSTIFHKKFSLFSSKANLWDLFRSFVEKPKKTK